MADMRRTEYPGGGRGLVLLNSYSYLYAKRLLQKALHLKRALHRFFECGKKAPRQLKRPTDWVSLLGLLGAHIAKKTNRKPAYRVSGPSATIIS